LLRGGILARRLGPKPHDRRPMPALTKTPLFCQRTDVFCQVLRAKPPDSADNLLI
jgi:hypothetical protein